MQIQPGSNLGSYEIVAPLGAGGMGEVYRAHDPKLGRDVAIKVLPEDLASDPERLTRFEREARALAALNHPNIATVHGFERDTSEDGARHFLVMELVEGEDLAERIRRAPLPVDEAIPLFVQIAEGLEAAHERGIVHRDLKPANIKVTEEGRAKILDFGLAKALDPIAASHGDLSQSPTMTLAATMRGEILGTAAYMSPEQARGKAVDKRTDNWAFGVCLFEALTGARAFGGEDASMTMAKILEGDVPWEDLPSSTPPRVRRVLRRCLKKNPRDRLHDVADARIDLLDDGNESEPAGPAPPARGSRWPWLVAAAAAALAILLGIDAMRRDEQSPVQPLEFEIPLEAGTSFASFAGRHSKLALSPDGLVVVWAGEANELLRLYRRRLDSVEISPIDGTEGAIGPMFSPDGRWLAFSTDTELRKVPVEGGRPVTLAQVTSPAGGHWAPDGFLYLPVDGSWSRIPAQGGPIETVIDREAIVSHTGIENSGNLSGQQLGDLTLLTVGRLWDSWLSVWDPSTGTLERLAGAPQGRSPDGTNLLFSSGDALYRTELSASRRALVGEPEILIEGIERDSYSFAQFSAAPDGTVAWIPPGADYLSELALVELSGRVVEAIDLGRERISQARISADGTRIAFDSLNARDRSWSVSVYDLERGGVPRVISGELFAWGPVWSTDSRKVFFSTGEDRGSELLHAVYSVELERSSEPEKLHEAPYADLNTQDISVDGQFLVFSQKLNDTGWDTWLLDLETSQARALTTDAGRDWGGRISPDGRWLVYQSARGISQIFVRSFPEGDVVRQVTTDGGQSPTWSADGRTVYYTRGGTVMAVDFEDEGGEVKTGAPRPLFSGPYRSGHMSLDFDARRELFLLRRYSDANRPRVRVHRHLVRAPR